MQIRKPDIHISVFLLIIAALILTAGCSDDKPTSSIQYGWAPLETGIDNAVVSLAVYDNKLIAGGAFTAAGAVSANRIAVWNDTAWSTFGTGFDYGVFSLTVFDNKLIAGGRFTTADAVSASAMAAWDGSSWAPLGTGMNYPADVARVWVLSVFDAKLIAGGYFTEAGGWVPAVLRPGMVRLGRRSGPA